MKKMGTPVKKAICFALYGAGAYFGLKKKNWIPCAALAATHCAEFVLQGNEVGKKAGIPFAKRFANCMLYGIVWWKDLKAAQEAK